MRHNVLLVAALFIAAAPQPDEPYEYQRDALTRLASASTAHDLRTALASVDEPDDVTALVFWTRMVDVEPGPASDSGLITALPKDESTFWRVYRITYEEWGRNNALSAIAGGGYLEAAAKAVVRQRRGMRAFFELNYFSDGEIAIQASDWTKYIFDAIPGASREAIAEIPETVRARLPLEHLSQ
jgi:hypothetical protein